MTTCRHKALVLMGGQGKKLRCRHCHLTIEERELGGGHCPECLEVYGVRRRDFDMIEPEEGGTVSYRCEACGALIETV